MGKENKVITQEGTIISIDSHDYLTILANNVVFFKRLTSSSNVNLIQTNGDEYCFHIDDVRVLITDEEAKLVKKLLDIYIE